jgi:hypothetical protein
MVANDINKSMGIDHSMIGFAFLIHDGHERLETRVFLGSKFRLDTMQILKKGKQTGN